MTVHKSFAAFERSLDRRLEKMTKGAVREISKKVLDDTPRLTNQLVSNWNISFNVPDYTFTEGKTDLGSYADLNTSITSWDGKSDYYFANAAPYAWQAEYGGWTQTPPYAMVRINTINWENIARKHFKRYFS